MTQRHTRIILLKQCIIGLVEVEISMILLVFSDVCLSKMLETLHYYNIFTFILDDMCLLIRCIYIYKK